MVFAMRNNKFQDKIRNFMYENSRKRDKKFYIKKESFFFSDLMDMLEDLDDYIGEIMKEFEYSKKHKRR